MEYKSAYGELLEWLEEQEKKYPVESPSGEMRMAMLDLFKAKILSLSPKEESKRVFSLQDMQEAFQTGKVFQSCGSEVTFEEFIQSLTYRGKNKSEFGEDNFRDFIRKNNLTKKWEDFLQSISKGEEKREGKPTKPIEPNFKDKEIEEKAKWLLFFFSDYPLEKPIDIRKQTKETIHELYMQYHSHCVLHNIKITNFK